MTTTIHYFVDEAGTPTLFGKKGSVLVGTEGCSRFFLLGKLDIDEPEALASPLAELRRRLLADPWFRRVPSMQVDAGKTAMAFHAKDDLPEVRREVFTLLLQHQLKFYAVIRDKERVVTEVQERNRRGLRYRYTENELYDGLVSRLFKDRWLKADHFNIVFAKRGTSTRTEAFRMALKNAHQEFERDWGVHKPVAPNVECSTPALTAGLQAVDYFLWALQRLYETGEERFWELVWPKVGVVIDVDAGRGSSPLYYTQDNPLTTATRGKK
jgi:hypothetical protein